MYHVVKYFILHRLFTHAKYTEWLNTFYIEFCLVSYNGTSLVRTLVVAPTLIYTIITATFAFLGASLMMMEKLKTSFGHFV